MKMSQLFMPTLREVPAEAVIVSHRLMLRAGLIRKLGNGLYSYLPMGLKAFRKVENIIREEMDNIGALEIKPTVVVPGELWRESGRWDTMGDAMAPLKDVPEFVNMMTSFSNPLIGILVGALFTALI